MQDVTPLKASGRIANCAGRVMGSTLLGARLLGYDAATDTYAIRVDDERVLEFYLEVHVSQKELDACKAACTTDLDSSNSE